MEGQPESTCRHDPLYPGRGSCEEPGRTVASRLRPGACFLKDAGLDTSSASQSDGAGGDAFFTPDFMVQYLLYYSRQAALFPAFLRALPVMGKDGTLWDIQTDSPAAGHVYAKTGTLGGADLLNHSVMLTGKGIAGYIDRRDGQRTVFAAYVSMVDGDPETIIHRVGNVLGEIAAAAYDAPL
ncbi:MAG: D-alanyl-D-alanine carboxypeptidase [Bryobacteraceae bacterium]